MYVYTYHGMYAYTYHGMYVYTYHGMYVYMYHGMYVYTYCTRSTVCMCTRITVCMDTHVMVFTYTRITVFTYRIHVSWYVCYYVYTVLGSPPVGWATVIIGHHGRWAAWAVIWQEGLHGGSGLLVPEDIGDTTQPPSASAGASLQTASINTNHQTTKTVGGCCSAHSGV